MKLNFKKQKIESDLFSLLKNTVDDKKYGFFYLTENSIHLEQSKKIYEKFKAKTHFVQIGIGGSALGPQMLVDALGNSEVQFTFLDNTDPENTHDKLKKVDFKNALFYVVSKSGGTAETIANFIICYNKLLDMNVTKEQMKEYFVFSTDPQDGELKKLANEDGFDTLEVPNNIGGRFSVLSSVGLLPALFASIDIDKLYAGANKMKDHILAGKNESSLVELSQKIYSLHNLGIKQTILMPYSSKLKNFSHWFVQLWGESLGKVDANNKSVGLTPIPAYGATDQHSQMQLFMEGENDKFIILLNILQRKCDFNLSSDLNLKSAQKLKDRSLSQLINAQLKGTLKALEDRKRHVALIEVEQNDEVSMGELIIFFESLTVLVGRMLNVNPFDQPGVELGKKYAFEYLNS